MTAQTAHQPQKHYAVVGLGSSGLSAVKFLVAQGHQVSITDENTNPTLAKSLPQGVQCFFGKLDAQLLTCVDGVVISPGIDPRLDAIVAAKKAGVPVVSDIQVFAEQLHQRNQQAKRPVAMVCITGSNAKSTVTTLVAQMAQDAGLVVGAGGNLGTPALELLGIDDLEMAVLELSSFQLEHVSHLGADVATVLNLSADHLDRHGDMAGYLAQKLRIFDDAKTAVIALDDESLALACRGKLPTGASVLTTSSKDAQADFYLDSQQGKLCLCHQNQVLIWADEMKIKGKHNLMNALSALALGASVGLPVASMVKTLKQFKGLAHRCEYVDEVSGKAYFNDSKGTNIGSTIAAIDGLGAVYGKHSLALILGGQGKGQDFSELAGDVSQFAETVYLIGEDAQVIAQGLSSVSPQRPLVQAGTLQNAVQLASQSGAKAVLLSPACASFDQFKGYADRGEQFVAQVRSLTGQG